MSRLKEAGINPNLVYGNSSVVGNTSTQTPKYQRPEVPRASMKLELPNMLSMLNMYQDIQNKGVQHDNLTKQTELMSKESELKTLNMLKITSATEKNKAEKMRIDRLIDNQVKILEQQTIGERYKTNMLSQDWENYHKYGIRPNDSILYRGAVKAKDKVKNFFNDWLEGAKKSNKQGQLQKTW
jgi:hypothetical protein